MKEKILQELKTRAAKSGCSERTIQTYAENIPTPAAEDDLTEEFFNSHVNILNAMGGQMSRGIAEQVADFKKNFKPTQQPTSEPEGTPPANPNDEIAAQLKALRDRLDQKEREETQRALLANVDQMMREQGATNEHLRRPILRNAQISEADTAATLTEKYKREYDEQYRNLYGDSGVPGAGNGQASVSKFDAKAEVERLRAAGMIPPGNN